MAVLALIPLVAWLTWQGLGGIRPSVDNAERANATLEQAPTGAGLPPTSNTTSATGLSHSQGASAPAVNAPLAAPAPIVTAGASPSSGKSATPPAESASQAQGPKGAVLIKGLGFLTIDDPADKPEPSRAREEGIKPKPVTRVSERPAAPPKGADPCQDINRKLSTQDPTPEDIAFLKRGCK